MKPFIITLIYLLLSYLPTGHSSELIYEKASFAEIINKQQTDLKIYEWQHNSKIIILDFPDLYQQGAMFNRIVALIERIGVPRDRVFNNQELTQYIRSVGRTAATFAFGNDFQVSELVVFFNLAETGNIALNDEEKWLRNFLLSRHWIHHTSGFYQLTLPNRIILSIPQQQAATTTTPPVTALARETILRHELSHGEYFSNQAYANYCRYFWQTVLSEQERQLFRRFLSANAYDPRQEEIMINEMQAYLMHTPDPRGFNAYKLGVSEEIIQQWREKFMQGNPPTELFKQTIF